MNFTSWIYYLLIAMWRWIGFVLSHMVTERLVTTALNTVAKNPKAFCRLCRTEHRYQLIRSLVGARTERKCNLCHIWWSNSYRTYLIIRITGNSGQKHRFPGLGQSYLTCRNRCLGTGILTIALLSVTGILFVNSFPFPQFIDWPLRSHLMTSLSLSSTDLPHL